MSAVSLAPMREPNDWMDERAAICSELGCINEPGVALRFIKQLREEVRKGNNRNLELLKSWDPISPTDKQELDRMRRGWGPSTPTERMSRREDLIAIRRFIDRAYEAKVDLIAKPSDYTEEDVIAVNEGAAAMFDHIVEGQKFINDKLVEFAEQPL